MSDTEHEPTHEDEAHEAHEDDAPAVVADAVEAISDAEEAVAEAAAEVAAVAEHAPAAGLDEIRTTLRGIEAMLGTLSAAVKDMSEKHAAGTVETVAHDAEHAAEAPVEAVEDLGHIDAPSAPVEARPDAAKRGHRRKLGRKHTARRK